MRHGPAEDRAASGRDADRVLSEEGRARVRRVAEELRRERGGAPPPRVLASPLVRARATAEILAEVLGAGGAALEVEIRDELALDADLPLGLAAQLGTTGADTVLVGHAPNVDHLVRSLLAPTGQRPPPAVASGFCTAMIVALEPLGGAAGWQVRGLIDPRQLP